MTGTGRTVVITGASSGVARHRRPQDPRLAGDAAADPQQAIDT